MKYSHLSLTWFGDITSCSGAAYYARSILEPLIRGGASIKLEPANFGAPQLELSPWWTDTLNRLVQSQPGYIKINHCSPEQVTANVLGGPNVLLSTNSVTYMFPTNWNGLVNRNHSEVIFPITLPDYLTPGVSIPKHVLPIPVQEVQNSELSKLTINSIPPNTFVFGYFGPWNQVSNIQDLITAYVSEFSTNDDTTLVIKTAGSAGADANQKAHIIELVKRIKGTVGKPDHPPVTVIQDVLSDSTVSALINRFDAYVSTDRGSHFNVTLARCLALGKPCIAPEFGAGGYYKKILPGDTRMLRTIPCFKEPVTSHPGGNPQDRWGRIDIDAAMKFMRLTYNEVKSNDKIFQKHSQKTIDLMQAEFGTEVVADKLASKLASLMPFKPMVLGK